MTTFEEALTIARRLRPKVNYCSEFREAFYFYRLYEDGSALGTGESSIVIMKEDGSITTMVRYGAEYAPREIKKQYRIYKPGTDPNGDPEEDLEHIKAQRAIMGILLDDLSNFEPAPEHDKKER